MAEIKTESDDETVVEMQPGAQDAYGAGVSCYALIVDVLGLLPKYKPHRNADAVTVARLLSRMIKDRLCRRCKGGPRGQLRWEFDSAEHYAAGLSILTIEPSAFRFQFM